MNLKNLNLRNKWTMGLLSLGAVAIVGFSASAVYAQTATPEANSSPLAAPQRAGRGDGEDHSALLAEVLGISEEELQTAVATARDAAIAQAVANGTITQEQADAMQAEEGGRGMGWGLLGKGADHDAELAEALGITLEELQTAKAEVNSRILDEAVASGEITQEEADLMQARQALREYLRDRMQTAYEAAVAQAVTDGVITQAQADQILSEEGAGLFGPGMGGGRHGGPGGQMDGGLEGGRGQGRGPGQTPDDAPAAPDSGTPEESSDTVAPSTNLDL